MAKRRAPREGGIYRSPDGAGWIAVLELPPLGDGRRRRRKRRAKTRAEAQDLLRKMKKEVAKTGSLTSAQRTVGDAVESYMTRRQLEKLAAGTRDNDRWLAGLIIAGLGRRKLDKLTVADCDQFLVACMVGLGDRRPIGRSHMAKLRQRLAAVLRNEMRVGTLSRNVAELAIVPGAQDQGDDGLGEEQGRRFPHRRGAAPPHRCRDRLPPHPDRPVRAQRTPPCRGPSTPLGRRRPGRR